MPTRRPATSWASCTAVSIYDLGGTLIGLRPVATDRFHEDRAGLDHIAFRLASKAELDSAAAHLDEVGVDARAGQRHRAVVHPGVPRPRQHRAGADRAEVAVRALSPRANGG